MMGFTRLSKLTAAVLVSLSAVCFFFEPAQQFLCLVPGKTIPWASMLFTAGLVELNPVILIVEVIGLLLMARAIEPLIGSRELLKFMTFVNVCTSVSTLVVMYCLYVATYEVKHLYEHFYGFHAIFGALLVAIKHIMPEFDVILFGLSALKFRAKYCPSIYLLVLTVVGCIPGIDEEQLLPFAWFGVYFGWLYLRYLQPKPESNSRGDPGDDFKFCTFFPPFAHGVVDKIVSLGGIADRLHGEQAPKPAAPAHTALPGTEGADAQRRRERGAKALEARLIGIAGMKDAAPTSPDESQEPPPV